MLEKEYIKQLLKDEKYDKISKYLYDVYSKMLEMYILKKEGFCQKGTIVYKAELIAKKYPKYSNLMKILLETILDEDKILIDRLNEMINIYPMLKKELV